MEGQRIRQRRNIPGLQLWGSSVLPLLFSTLLSLHALPSQVAIVVSAATSKAGFFISAASGPFFANWNASSSTGEVEISMDMREEMAFRDLEKFELQVPAAPCAKETKRMCDQIKRTYTGVQLQSILVSQCLAGADKKYAVRVRGFEFKDKAMCVEYSNELASISLGENSLGAFSDWCVRVDAAIHRRLPRTTPTTTTTPPCDSTPESGNSGGGIERHLKGIRDEMGHSEEKEFTRKLRRFRKSLQEANSSS